MSSADPGASSCRYMSPTFGWASMTIPAFAPFLPACHEPPVLTLPPWYSFVSSPKYQTFPARSCAYQSSVSSTTCPPTVTRSRTTVVTTPRMVFVSCVTSTVSASVHSSDLPANANTVPGTSGNHGLSTRTTNASGSNRGVTHAESVADAGTAESPPAGGEPVARLLPPSAQPMVSTTTPVSSPVTTRPVGSMSSSEGDDQCPGPVMLTSSTRILS